MGYKSRILEEAQGEYRAVVRYLHSIAKNPIAARDFVDEFARQVQRISENPTMCRLSRLPELSAYGYRLCLVNNYAMLYRIHDEHVVIAHVFHQSQDYAKFV